MSDEEEEEPLECRVVVLGENGVGKTSIINRYVNNSFGDTMTTAGATFNSKKVFFNDFNKEIEFEIWDTGEHYDRYKFHYPYYKDASACIFVYDICSKYTFDQLKNYGINTVKENANVNLCNLIFNNNFFL